MTSQSAQKQKLQDLFEFLQWLEYTTLPKTLVNDGKSWKEREKGTNVCSTDEGEGLQLVVRMSNLLFSLLLH